jgi:hypothetical protein
MAGCPQFDKIIESTVICFTRLGHSHAFLMAGTSFFRPCYRLLWKYPLYGLGHFLFSRAVDITGFLIRVIFVCLLCFESCMARLLKYLSSVYSFLLVFSFLPFMQFPKMARLSILG